MQSKNNKISILYISSVLSAVFLSLVFFSLFFLTDKIQPVIDNIFADSGQETPVDGADNKLTVSQETENYEAIISKYTNYLNSSYFIVVNKDNPLPEDYSEPTLATLSNSARKLEERTASAFEELIAAADSAGCTKHIVISGYRTADEQASAFNESVQSYMSGGYTQSEAEIRASMSVAKPNESEFQTGLLVEIAETRTMTSADFVNTDLYKFLRDNAHRYGFIFRFPENKSNITGFEFNSMILRYVGNAESSTYIYENNLTIEEYIDYMKIAKLDAEQKLEFLK